MLYKGMIFHKTKQGTPHGLVSGSFWCEPGFETPAAQITYRFMPKKKKKKKSTKQEMIDIKVNTILICI